MRALLVGAQGGVDRRVLSDIRIRSSDFCVGIDQGVLWAQKLGLRVDFAVGDWDSLKDRSVLHSIPHVSLNPDKERSDLFYAGIAAIEAGAKELIFLGVTGGRPDHHLAMLYDLSGFAQGTYGCLRQVQSFGQEAEYSFLSERIPHWSRVLRRGEWVSVFAMGGEARGVSLMGFKFGLKNAVLKSSSQGLSNEAKGGKSKVHVKKGKLVVILPHDLTEHSRYV